MSTLLGFDTSYLFYRAFFGVPSSMRAPDGSPVNAIKGTLDAIARLVDQYSPDLIACAWDDDWRPQWRTELVPSYKAHRVVTEVDDGVDLEETPDELAPQVPIIRAVLAELGIPVVGAVQHEADDVLASLAAQHEGRTLVATGDRDLFQLVDADTQVVYVGAGVAKNVVVDEAWLLEKYSVPASRYVDFAVLKGDPSDGLPGVKGVGEKSAAKLVSQFESLADLVEAARSGTGGLTATVRSRIEEAADYIVAAEPVVQTVRDLDLAVSPASLPINVPDSVEARLRDDLGLGGTATRIASALRRS